MRKPSLPVLRLDRYLSLWSGTRMTHFAQTSEIKDNMHCKQLHRVIVTGGAHCNHATIDAPLHHLLNRT